MKPGNLLRARKSFTFAWPKPDSARRIFIDMGDEFKVEKLLENGCVRVNIDGERIDLKPKHFERVT